MRFQHIIQAMPAALTPLKRGVWAAWFCLADARGHRPFAVDAPPGVAYCYAPPLIWLPLRSGQPGLNRRLIARLTGNIREGPD